MFISENDFHVCPIDQWVMVEKELKQADMARINVAEGMGKYIS